MGSRKRHLHKKPSALICFRLQKSRQRILANRINGQPIRFSSSSHQQVALPGIFRNINYFLIWSHRIFNDYTLYILIVLSDVTSCSSSKPMDTRLDSYCALSTEEVRELGRLVSKIFKFYVIWNILNWVWPRLPGIPHLSRPSLISDPPPRSLSSKMTKKFR